MQGKAKAIGSKSLNYLFGKRSLAPDMWVVDADGPCSVHLHVSLDPHSRRVPTEKSVSPSFLYSYISRYEYSVAALELISLRVGSVGHKVEAVVGSIRANVWQWTFKNASTEAIVPD